MKKKFFKYIFSKNINALFVLILLFFSSQNIVAQEETHELNITLKLKIYEGDLKNSMITITKKGMPFKVIDPNRDNFEVDLPVGSDYLFTFRKIGYITKIVSVDTHVPEGREKSEFAKKNSDIELDIQPEGRLITYPKPVASLSYSIRKRDFAWDKDVASEGYKMQKKEKENTNSATKPETPTIENKKQNPVIATQSENNLVNTVKKPIITNKEVKVIQEDYKKFTIITITIDDKKYVYRKEEFNFSTFYYKDGLSIGADTYENETK